MKSISFFFFRLPFVDLGLYHNTIVAFGISPNYWEARSGIYGISS
jgi:hypothetical protein